MSYMDQAMAKAQEMRQKVEQKAFAFRNKMPFPAAKTMKLRSGPKITMATVKNRQVRTAVKAKFPALRTMNLADIKAKFPYLRNSMVGSRRGLRSGVPIFPLLGPRVGTTDRVPPVVEDREPRPANGYNISVEL